MNWEEKLYNKNEKPLDSLVSGYSHTSVFRTIAFVGDSMSSGEFETLSEDGTKGYHDFFEYSWGQHIARKNGLKAYSFSRGGMTAKEYVESYAQEKGFWDTEKAAQAYVIALGVNDCNAQTEIGSVDDIKEDYRNNAKTYTGYYAQIVARYKEISPEAKFFFVTFPDDPKLNWCGDNIGNVNRVLYSLAEHFDNAYVIDLNKYGPLFDERFKEQFFMLGHMNPSGYILMAEIVDSYIDYIVRHNPKDFGMVAFSNDIEKSWQFFKSNK